MWEDLTSNNEPHFLGSFIFNTGAEAGDYVEIIDGQQRLLTVTIMAAVLRDLAKTFDPKKGALYQAQDIAILNRDGSQSFRLLPADSIKDYFQQYIQNGDQSVLTSDPSASEEKRVKNNYRHVYDRVHADLEKEPTPGRKIDLLDRLRKKIAEVIVINIEITREEDAYEIFETTNARGLELSVADLLKNLIFKNIPVQADRDFAKEVWQGITEDVESTNTDLRKFIR